MTDFTSVKIIKGSRKAFMNHTLLSLGLRLLMLSQYTLGKSLTHLLRLALIQRPKCIKSTYLCLLRINCRYHIVY